MRKLIIALLVLVGVAIAVDRITVSAAESVVARRAQVVADLEQEPQVQIAGFPFLTQAIRGEYRSVDLSVSRLQRDNGQLRNLVVHLKDVHAPLMAMLRRDSSIQVRAESARASAVMPYKVVESRLPDSINIQRGAGSQSNGQLRLTADITQLGQQFSVTALVTPSVSDGKLQFRANDVQAEGVDVPDQVANQFNFTADIGKLPFGLRLTRVAVRENGIRVTARGEGLHLTNAEATARGLRMPGCDMLAFCV